ncbi:hypothetical protein NMY22_g20309 [Coprinellus aureogranulatus]|nr:hypothetical protein NMY22_g20309 [Coprinellus aureogranulatus]
MDSLEPPESVKARRYEETPQTQISPPIPPKIKTEPPPTPGLFTTTPLAPSSAYVKPVCQTDDACIGFPLAGGINNLLSSMKGSELKGSELTGEGEDGDAKQVNMTCYTGGETVFNNHQIILSIASCTPTDRKILDMLPDRPPQVTFSCNKADSTCGFQFWTAQVESFYCGLSSCTSSLQIGYDSNTTTYECEEVKCKCVPGRFICGEAGSVDIGDF